MNKDLMWILGLIFIIIIICGTIIYLTNNPFILRFEMDDNSLEAIKSINWTEI